MNQNNRMTLNLICLLSKLYKNLGFIICIMFCMGCSYDVFSTLTYTPKYASTLKGTLKVDDNSYSTLETASSYVTTLDYVFNGQVCKQAILDELDVDSTDVVTHVYSENNTNIIYIQTVSKSKRDAYYALNAIENWYNNNASQYHLTYDISIIDKPSINDSPTVVNSHIKNFRNGALASGVLILVIYALTVYFSQTIKAAGDIEKYIDCRLFAKLPKEKKEKHRHGKKALLITSLKTSFKYKEGINKLRNRFEKSTSEHDYKTIMVTSSIENEGKSTIAANLALSLAQNGHKVLLIDADLRKPSLHKIFEINNKRSLNNYLSGKESWENQVNYIKKNDLFVICANEDISHAENLLSDRFPELLRVTRDTFDYVIVDVSPVLGVNEPLIINEMVDASLLVVKQNEARVSMINDTISKLVQAKNNLIGCIYNASIFDVTSSQKVYGYRYGYNRYNHERGSK